MKLKKYIILISAVIGGFILGSCGNSVIAGQTHPLKIWKENRNGQMETWKVVDDETGVNYIVVAPSYSENGQPYAGISITPRLNSDGSLYISN